MLRSALMLAAIIAMMPAAQAQMQTTQGDQLLKQTWDSDDAASATTGQRKEAPFPDMMTSFEYTPQEWQ